jgi:WD40 repeat protein
MLLAVTVLALAPSPAHCGAPAVPDATVEKSSNSLSTDVAEPGLPPRALVRIGTDDLRMADFITTFAFSPDGRLIAAADANAPSPRVAIFDLPTGRRVKEFVAPGKKGGHVESVAFSPDGTKLLWGESGGEVARWDLAGNQSLFRENLHGVAVAAVAFSLKGSLMASAGGAVICLRRVEKPVEAVRDFATLLQPARGEADAPKPPHIGGADRIGCLAFTPDGTRLVGGTSGDSTLLIWQIQDGKLLRRIPHTHGASGSGSTVNPRLNCVAVTPDGRRIMSVGQTTKLLKETKLKYGSTNATMSEVQFWDFETGQRMADYRGDEDYGFGFGALSPDGRRVAVGDFSRLRILDAATGRPLQTIELPGSWGRRPAFSPDGTLVAKPIDNTIGLFEVSSGRRLHHDASTPVGSIVSAAWSPSGDRIVIGHGDGFVRVWDAATGKLIWHKLLAPVINRSGWNNSAAFVSFSRDGKLVVAAGRRLDPVKHDNGLVVIYEAADGRTVREVPQKEIRWAALEPDGRMLVVATSNGSRDDTHMIGVEVSTGRIRWANPAADKRQGFYPLAGMHFEGDTPWFEAAMSDGNVIRFNALTGHEQRRFLADWRTPEQQKAGQPRLPAM